LRGSFIYKNFVIADNMRSFSFLFVKELFVITGCDFSGGIENTCNVSRYEIEHCTVGDCVCLDTSTLFHIPIGHFLSRHSQQ
jgi:hypothetical protein